MRYAQGGGLNEEGRGRRERVRLAAAEMFEQKVPVPQIAKDLRVSRRPVELSGDKHVGPVHPI